MIRWGGKNNCALLDGETEKVRKHCHLLPVHLITWFLPWYLTSGFYWLRLIRLKLQVYAWLKHSQQTIEVLEYLMLTVVALIIIKAIINRLINKVWCMVYVHNNKLLIHRKELNYIICRKISQTENHHITKIGQTHKDKYSNFLSYSESRYL